MTEKTVTIDGTEYRVDIDELTIEETPTDKDEIEQAARDAGIIDDYSEWEIVEPVNSYYDYDYCLLVCAEPPHTENVTDYDIGALEDALGGVRYIGFETAPDDYDGEETEQQWIAENAVGNTALMIDF